MWEILQVNVESNVSSKRTRFPQSEKAVHEYFFKQETNCNILLHIYFNKNKCPTLLQPFFLQFSYKLTFLIHFLRLRLMHIISYVVFTCYNGRFYEIKLLYFAKRAYIMVNFIY